MKRSALRAALIACVMLLGSLHSMDGNREKRTATLFTMMTFAVDARAEDDDGDDGGGAGGGASSPGGFSAESGGGNAPMFGNGRASRRVTGRERLRLRRLFRPPVRASRTERGGSAVSRQPVVRRSLPRAAADELVAFSLSDGDLSILVAQGFAVLEELEVPLLQNRVRRLQIPSGTDAEEALDRVRSLPTGGDADFNHYFRLSESEPSCNGKGCGPHGAFGWQVAHDRNPGCGSSMTIGMIDTGVNPDHETFDGARMTVHRLDATAPGRSSAVHGTAIASLLAGSATSRSPGLLPGASLIVVDAFRREGGDERADAFSLIKGLAYLAEAGATVINLSIAGPFNQALEKAVLHMAGPLDTLLVAAVGNSGPASEPQYPAAFGAVVAVTAVDAGRKIYRRAVRGAHVDVAAPGVGVWAAASIRGIRKKTGTSFAAPFVTAAAAMLRETMPDQDQASIVRELVRRTQDLGEPGRDSVFGYGLLRPDAYCVRETTSPDVRPGAMQ